MQIRRLQLKNFRCFAEFEIDLDAPLILISGANGSGKTSLLEALHYACYLRSFRTHIPSELLSFEADNFFIKIYIYDKYHELRENNEIQVGFSGRKRLVKIDQKAINSYKELTNYYRVVTISEDDLELINGNPEGRRSFIDQALILHDPDFLAQLRLYKQILNNRNALLYKRAVDVDSYDIWTKQLWQQGLLIQEKRLKLMEILEKSANILLYDHFDKDILVALKYQAKKRLNQSDFQEFKNQQANLYEQEMVMGRTLFGIHLDDFNIEFKGKRSKRFASRGQQKLIMILLKIALLEELKQNKGPAVLLLDDFMTDFDPTTGAILLEILTKLSVQLIFTSPIKTGQFVSLLIEKGVQQHLLV